MRAGQLPGRAGSPALGGICRARSQPHELTSSAMRISTSPARLGTELLPAPGHQRRVLVARRLRGDDPTPRVSAHAWRRVRPVHRARDRPLRPHPPASRSSERRSVFAREPGRRRPESSRPWPHATAAAVAPARRWRYSRDAHCLPHARPLRAHESMTHASQRGVATGRSPAVPSQEC